MPTATAPAVPTAAMPTLASTADGSKRDWHATTTLQVRRRVLLQILLLLKTKYGKVDAKISYIARRAELALYTQAYSAEEYRNPKTLNRRLHSLVVKLHMNNLAAHEDQIFVGEKDAVPSTNAVKRAREEDGAAIVSLKRRRSSIGGEIAPAPHHQESILFFRGNHDLLRQVCSFLGERDCLQLAATNTVANTVVPSFITSISVSVRTLETLSPAMRTSFFSRFENLQNLEVHGDPQSHLQFDFQNEIALVRRNVVCRSLLVALSRQSLQKLECVRWHYAFVDGVNDRITSQLASVLIESSQFPKLNELSLVGNAVSDDGVASMCEAWATASTPLALRILNLEQNFVGERGQLLLEELAANREKLGGERLVVRLNGNLLTPQLTA